MVPITRTPVKSSNSAKPKRRPTHRVRHVNGWEVAIYIAPSLQEQLKSPLVRQRQDAESSVAIRFRVACKQKFPGFNVGHIYYHDLLLTQLEEEEYRPAPPATAENKFCTCPDDNCPYCSGDNGRSHYDCPNCAIGS